MYSKQKSLNFGNYVPNDKVLNKKIPENPRYKHVRPAVDTGKNIRNHIDELKEKQKNCIHKKDEVFKRIKVSAFIKLALACVEELTGDETDMVEHLTSPDVPKNSNLPERRCLANVLMGIGELDLMSSRKKAYSAPLKPVRLMPYILLDVRDRDAFSQCHIITAKHYPSAILSRSIGYEIEDLKLYKNCPGAIVVVYDDDESIATRVATTLVERGYENVYLLTGGLKLAIEICPHGLTTSSQMLTPVHMFTHGATSQPPKTGGKEYFSPEDVATIQHYMDTYPNRGNNIFSSSHSRSTKSSVSGHRSSLESAAAASRTSTTSRKDSTNNSSTAQLRHQQSASSKNSRLSHTHSNSTKSAEHMHCKPVIDEKSRKIKRAPWK